MTTETTTPTAAGPLDKDAWIRRYAARLVERSGCEQWYALENAEAGWELSGQDQDIYSPENCADDEMSYWDDDGEG